MYNNFLKSLLLCLLVFSSSFVFSQVEISSIEELKAYSRVDSITVKMKPGTYYITPEKAAPDKVLSNPTLFSFTGNGSTYDFEGARIVILTTVFQSYGNVQVIEMSFEGNNNVIKNLTMEDSVSTTTRPSKTALAIQMDGRENLLLNAHLTIRGSYPYGYGDIFGKGSTNVVKHYKHSAILVRGESNHVKDCTVIHRAYGHCIFMQAASNPIVEGCYLEGEMRSTDDMLAEEGTGTIADQKDFMTVWGYKLPAGYMLSCQEEGIRAYNAGTTYIDGVKYERGTSNSTVINNTVKHFRGGVTQSHAKGTVLLSGNTLIGCEGGYSVPDYGTITNCTADVSYGPALGFAYASDNDAKVDITINQLFDTYNGYNSIAYIGGSKHNITFRLEDGAEIDSSLVIKVSGDRNSLRHMEGANASQNNHTASNIVINNYTNNKIVLAPKSSNCTGESYTEALDSGTNNNITVVEPTANKEISTQLGEFNCFPNPAKDMVNISSPYGIRELLVTSVLGREVLRSSVEDKQLYSVNTSNFAEGVYLFHVTDNLGAKATLRVLVD